MNNKKTKHKELFIFSRAVVFQCAQSIQYLRKQRCRFVNATHKLILFTSRYKNFSKQEKRRYTKERNVSIFKLSGDFYSHFAKKSKMF